MSEDPVPERIAVNWSPEARTDLRAIEREAAIQILHCLGRYLVNRAGDVKKLKPPRTGFRLRCDRDYRRPEPSRSLPLSSRPVKLP